MQFAGSARVGPRPAYGDERVSHWVGPHDRFGLPVGSQADECYGDRTQSAETESVVAHRWLAGAGIGTALGRHLRSQAVLQLKRRSDCADGGGLIVRDGAWDPSLLVSEQIEFGGRKGFIRQALDRGVPIVPVVAIGGQGTALFATRGERAAEATGWAKLTRIKVPGCTSS
jgi:hypothetical protein